MITKKQQKIQHFTTTFLIIFNQKVSYVDNVEKQHVSYASCSNPVKMPFKVTYFGVSHNRPTVNQ